MYGILLLKKVEKNETLSTAHAPYYNRCKMDINFVS